LTSRERILAALALKVPDRVPVSLHTFNIWSDGWESQDPSYRDLIKFAREHTDWFLPWGPSGVNAKAFMTSHPAAALDCQTTREGDRTHYLCTANTPRGPLHQVVRTVDNIHTAWTLDHWLKTDEDIERFLSIPYEPIQWDCSSFAQTQADMGDRGVMFPGIADPICYVADLFEFGEFTVRAFTDPRSFRHLLDAMFPRVMDQLTAMLQAGVGGLFRLVGPEYASPPYLPVELFREYVVRYDRPIIDLIHQHGQLVRVHCHGRCGRLLEIIADELDADALDPIEAPPSGDVSLAEAKGRIGDRVCLCGNMQFRDLETASPQQIDRLVRQSIEEAADGGGFVLMPTAEPLTSPLSPQTERNYYQYVESAHKWGRY
jgi:hypothetical protein